MGERELKFEPDEDFVASAKEAFAHEYVEPVQKFENIGGSINSIAASDIFHWTIAPKFNLREKNSILIYLY